MAFQVILGKGRNQAEEVLIPLSDWQSLEPYVDRDSDLYRLMTSLMPRPIFNMSSEDFAAFIKPVAEEAIQKSRDLGLPDIYKNELCRDDAQFIRKYSDGQKELVILDIATRSFKVLKKLGK